MSVLDLFVGSDAFCVSPVTWKATRSTPPFLSFPSSSMAIPSDAVLSALMRTGVALARQSLTVESTSSSSGNGDLFRQRVLSAVNVMIVSSPF